MLNYADSIKIIDGTAVNGNYANTLLNDISPIDDFRVVNGAGANCRIRPDVAFTWSNGRGNSSPEVYYFKEIKQK